MATMVASNNATTWSYWVSSGTTSSESETNVVWGTWTINSSAQTQVAAYHQPTPEEIERNQERQRRHREEQQRREAERAEAERRAEALLQDNLTQEQREMLARMQEFIVVGSKGKRYAIGRGNAHNVKELDDGGRKVKSLCALPSGVPVGDVMLAQKFLLETDEDAFLSIANSRVLVPA